MKVTYNTKNSLLFAIVILSLLVILSSLISALSVGIPGDLSLYPGQVFDTGFDIMNTIQGSSDLVLEAQFSEGSEIASFTKGNRFEVPRESSLPVYVRFKIPENAVVGSVYHVKVIFKTVSAGQGSGSVNFVEDVVRTFNVAVIEKPAELPAPAEEAKTGANTWIWIIAILIIIVIIIWFIKKRK